MAANRSAYVDTSAFIAFVDRSDTFHPLFRRLFAKPPQLVSTSLVIAEGHAWFLRRYDRNLALRFLAMIEDIDVLKIEKVDRKELQEGAAVLRRFSDQDLTMTDAVGMHIMSAQRFRSCWSTDHHLGLTGVPLVIHGD